MFQTITNNRNSSHERNQTSGSSSSHTFFNENLIQYLYNAYMGEAKFVFGKLENPEFLSSVRHAFDFGNEQQKAFIHKVYDALVQSIPPNEQYLFEDFSFDAFASEDDSVVIEFITPELYFSIDIEERTINSSWTFSKKKCDGTRISSGNFFNDKLTVPYVINSVCRQMIQWMEYGRLS